MYITVESESGPGSAALGSYFVPLLGDFWGTLARKRILLSENAVNREFNVFKTLAEDDVAPVAFQITQGGIRDVCCSNKKSWEEWQAFLFLRTFHMGPKNLKKFKYFDSFPCQRWRLQRNTYYIPLFWNNRSYREGKNSLKWFHFPLLLNYLIWVMTWRENSLDNSN